MTRFERELSGALGAYWKANAEKELESVRADLEAGKITVDENGIARNCIGRVLMNDMLEKLAHITDEVSIEATREARSEEVNRSLAAYRKNEREAGAEELNEMRAAFGEGQTVVNILTGKRYSL